MSIAILVILQILVPLVYVPTILLWIAVASLITIGRQDLLITKSRAIQAFFSLFSGLTTLILLSLLYTHLVR